MTKPAKRRGPKTTNGRAAVRHNALRHGMASPHPVIIEELETEDGWQRHLGGIVAYLAPEGGTRRGLRRSCRPLCLAPPPR